MIWAMAATFLVGALVSAPLLRGSRELAPAAVERLETRITWIMCPLLFGLLCWVAFRSYAPNYLRILGGVAALPVLIVFLLVVRGTAIHWRRLPQLAGVLALIAFGGSEGVLASAAAGGPPSRYPEMLHEMAGPRAAAGLGAALEHGDTEVRLLAAQKLKESGPAAIPVLARALNDSDDRIRMIAAASVSQAGDPRNIPAFTTLLRDRNDSVRSSARYGLSKTKDPAVVPALLAAMSEQEDFSERLSFQNVFANMGSTSRASLIQALSDGDKQLRRAAAEALADNGSAAVVQALSQRATKDPDEEVRLAAIASLSQLAQRSRQDEVLKLLALRDGSAFSIDRKAYIDADRVLSVMAAAAHDPAPNVRAAAAKGIDSVFRATEISSNAGALDPKDPDGDLTPLNEGLAVNALTALVNDPDGSVRSAALPGIAKRADRRALPGLIRVIQGDSEADQRYACQALVAIGDPSAIPALKQADRHSDDQGYCEFCKALYLLGAQDSIRHDIYVDEPR